MKHKPERSTAPQPSDCRVMSKLPTLTPFGRSMLLGLIATVFSAACALGAPRYDYPGAYGPPTRWASSFCLAGESPGVGDFDGDGYDDIATFVKNTSATETGWVYVALNNRAGGFGSAVAWNSYFCIDSEIPLTGDFNGDGKDDIATFLPDGGVFVAVSNGTAFIDSRNWYAAGTFMAAGATPLVGDFNGDGRDDIAVRSSSNVYASLSSGTSFGARKLWTGDFQTGVARAGDVNGDGCDDLVGFVQTTRSGTPSGDVEVALSNGSNAFVYGLVRDWHGYFATNANYDPHLADLNGDGAMDVVAVHTDGRLFAAISTGISFGSGSGGTNTGDPDWQWHRNLRNAGEIPLFGKFNSDLNDDAAIFVRNVRSGADNGAVLVSQCAGHAVPEPNTKLADFGYNTMGPGGTTLATRPLLLLVSVCSANPLPAGRTLAQYEAATFGPAHPCITGFFSEMSHGKFAFTKAGAIQVGPYACPIPGDSVKVQLEDAANQDGAGGFEFKNFDTNSDGTVSANELVVLGISTFPGLGQTFPGVTTLFPGTGRQVNINVQWSYVNAATSVDTWAHELGHAGCGTVDIYGSNCRSLGLTLASCSGATTYFNHLDAWHKMRLGWVAPLVYDIRDYPAGALLPPPQSAAERPVILYDSSRGTQDFHVLEHRNGDYSAGTPTVTAAGGLWNYVSRANYPHAGYDINVRSTSGERKGFVTWSVKTDAAHNVLDIIQRVKPGANGVIDSARLGDDILWPSAAAPTQIHCGADGVLQSVASGDDGYWQDGLCIPVPDPDNMLSRESSVLVPSGAAATTLHYYSNVAGAGDSGVMVRGDFVNGNAGQFLEWGRSFRPFITSLTRPAGLARPGQLIQLAGSLGQNRFIPSLVSPAGIVTPLDIMAWTGATATVRMPPTTWIPPGFSRLVLFDGAGREASSNALGVTVADPCAAWVTDYFTPGEILAGLSGDAKDPDNDNIPNLIEMIMHTNPQQANAAPYTWMLTGRTAAVSFAARTDRCAVRIVLQQSENLTTWTDGDSFTIIPTAGVGATLPGYLTSTAAAGTARRFHRLAVTRL